MNIPRFNVCLAFLATALYFDFGLLHQGDESMRDVPFFQRMIYEKQFVNKVQIIYLILENDALNIQKLHFTWKVTFQG